MVRTFGCLLVIVAMSACGAQSSRHQANERAGGAGGSAGSAGLGGASGSDPSSGGSGAISGTGASGADAGAAGDTGATGGAGGSAAGTGAAGADGGHAGQPEPIAGTAGTSGSGATLLPCNASAETACDGGGFCQDRPDGCDPSLEPECDGYCVTPLVRGCAGPGATEPCPEGYECVELEPSGSTEAPRTTCVESAQACQTDEECPSGFVCAMRDGSGRCAPERVACSGAITCPALAAPCPAGFVRSVVDECFGPCIRVEQCACSDDHECGAGPALCDRSSGNCAIPKAPAPRCLVPFDPNCGAGSFGFFAFVDGRCQSVTGGRCGLENEFLSLEECQTYCEGVPIEAASCAEGFTHATVCLSCGPVGGCGAMRELCAQNCTVGEDCQPGQTCRDGICDMQACF